MEIPLKQGRVINRTDDAGAEQVVVVNEAWARQYFANRNPLNALLRVTAPGKDSVESFRVVGVVGNALEKNLTAAASPILYFSNRQTSFPHATIVVRSKTNADIAARLQGLLNELDPELALDDVILLSTRVRASYALQIFYLVLLTTFAICASVLIGIGLFALLTEIVAAESKSNAIRLALGATSGRIGAAVVARSLMLTLFGASIGYVTLVAIARNISDLTAGTSLTAGSFLLGSFALICLTMIATCVPALRAANLEPASLLRN